MSLKFNNKRIGFNGKRLIASKADEINVPPINDPDDPVEPPVEEEYCPNCGEVWDGEYCASCGYPDNEDPGDDPGIGGVDAGEIELG